MNIEKSDDQDLFAEKMINFYRNFGDDFLWRRYDQDPYVVLIAEIFLQRTRREQVEKILFKFISKYPDLESLSEAPLTEIRECMKPLGLLWRADNVKDMAVKVKEDFSGSIPKDKDIYTLPGVGSYIGSMFLCIAHDKNTVPVDVNVARILNRVFDLGCDNNVRLSRRKLIRESAEKCAPVENRRDYNLGLVDFGSKICCSKRPLCEKCSLKNHCSFRM